MTPKIQLSLPNLSTPIPGPHSMAAARPLHAVEAIGISAIEKGARPIFWNRASGVMVEDIDGNCFLDCTSSFGVASVGYCHPRVQAAIVDQCNALVHTMPGICPHLAYVRALERIVGAVGRWDHSEVLLTNTGSEAIEVALKLSLRHTGRAGVVAFQGGFHGQSLGALSVTSHNGLRNPFAPIISHHVTWIPYPHTYRPAFRATVSSVADACLEYLRQILRADHTGGAALGAVLVEPMQNASGYIVPPDGFLRGLRAICNEFDVLLVFDEIFTGFGRTGYWLAADRESVVPDIVCIGKAMTGGVPSGACIAGHTIMSSLSHNGIIPLHGSTFAGNPIACAAITATIDVLRDEHLITRARTLGESLKSRISELCEQYSCVGEVRGLGAAIAIEFVKDHLGKERDSTLAWAVMENLLSRGVITIVTALPHGNVLAICPPFIITDEQCAYVLEALAQSIQAAQYRNSS